MAIREPTLSFLSSLLPQNAISESLHDYIVEIQLTEYK